MSTVRIVYGSTTGNTAEVADALGRLFEGAGHSVEILDAAKTKAEGLCQGQDLVLFGCSTWGDEEIELQDDFIPLFEKFDALGAKGVKTACFGCGDSSYTYFCGAVDEIEKKLREIGSVVVAGGLKIDGDPGDAKAEIEEWGKDILEAL
jgi:flavodoxin short chain